MVGDGNIVDVTRETGKIPISTSPDDVILSKIAFSSSARNSFEGKVIEIAIGTQWLDFELTGTSLSPLIQPDVVSKK